MDDVDIKHGDSAVFFDFFGPLNVGMDGIEVCVEWLYVVVANCYESVIRFPQPKQDELAGMDVFVTSRVIGKSCSFKIFHVKVR